TVPTGHGRPGTGLPAALGGFPCPVRGTASNRRALVRATRPAAGGAASNRRALVRATRPAVRGPASNRHALVRG
ncbi:MAG TPA: hypothetical protein VL025_03975, partial [Thermoanaerobaculia bacterium]|nr:hypothetical protein [Thermoanaerobaculia bacterium]